jgi:hypothetical protein
MFYPRGFFCRALVLSLLFATGCGTTRTTNTLRTATEQLLVSDAIDRAVQTIDFGKLAGQAVYLDEQNLGEVVDEGYLISSLRQHLLASGCILKDDPEQAAFIVEPRAGAVGTDSDELLFGIPATNLPQLTLASGLPSAVPELPIVKRRHQRGVAKIAVFAYRRETGEPVWQSGIATDESTANDVWFFGAGPFKRGTIHQGTVYDDPQHYLTDLGLAKQEQKKSVALGQEAVFAELLPVTSPPYVARAPRSSREALPGASQPSGAVGPSVLAPPDSRGF